MKELNQYREHLTDSVPENGVGDLVGSATGEEFGDTMAGGWEGTDDATSTAPSDLDGGNSVAPFHDPEAITGRAYGGGAGEEDGGLVDIKGTPVEDSRDWEREPIVEEK